MAALADDWCRHYPTDRGCDISSIHVYPSNDLIEHDADTEDCACTPRIDPIFGPDGGIDFIHVHHSLDGRERAE